MAALLDELGDAFVAFDGEWRFTFVNRRAVETFGYRPEELLGEVIWERFPRLLGTAFELEARRAVAESRATDFELYIHSWESWFEGRIIPSGDEIAVLVADVTEHVRARGERDALLLQLQRANALLDTLFENAPVGIGLWDLDLRFVRLNRALAEINGLPVDAHIGRRIGDLLPGARGEVMEAMRRVIETGETVSHETGGTTPAAPDLERFWSVNYFPIVLGGRIAGVGAICTEITDRKRAEHGRELLLAFEQDARQAAEEASRLKDEFLAVVSHELRTPLGSIVGWARLLRGGALDAETTSRALDSIERNATAQTRLVEDLIDVSQILADKLSVVVVEADLGAVVKAAVDTARPAATIKGIALELGIDGAPTIAGDPQRLEQAIGNLISNAIKFTPEAGRVSVALATDGGEAVLTVRDSGHGIEPGFLPYVFDRFRQADTSITRRHGGLGLGLAIARHIVELHGGALVASSDGPERGSTFTIRLPLDQYRVR
jgi:PAS domain S-box-containing protein